MMKFRDGARLPLLAALPVFLFLILLSTSPKHAFSREAPPTLREETDGGGDEWNDMATVAPTLGHCASSQTEVVPEDLHAARDSNWLAQLILWRLPQVGGVFRIFSQCQALGHQRTLSAMTRDTCK